MNEKNLYYCQNKRGSVTLHNTPILDISKQVFLNIDDRIIDDFPCHVQQAIDKTDSFQRIS